MIINYLLYLSATDAVSSLSSFFAKNVLQMDYIEINIASTSKIKQDLFGIAELVLSVRR